MIGSIKKFWVKWQEKRELPLIRLARPGAISGNAPDNGVFRLRYRQIVLKAVTRIIPQIKILTIVADAGGGLEDVLPHIPGSYIYFRLPQSCRPSTLKTISRLAGGIMRHYRQRLSISPERVFWIISAPYTQELMALVEPKANFTLLHVQPYSSSYAVIPLNLPAGFTGKAIGIRSANGDDFYLEGLTGDFKQALPLPARKPPGGKPATWVVKGLRQAYALCLAESCEKSAICANMLYIYPYQIKNTLIDKAMFYPSGRSNLAPVEIGPGFDWSKNPYNDNNWAVQLQMWRVMDNYILNFERTGNKDWLNIPRMIIENWADYYNDNTKKNEPYVWTDMASGMRAMRLAYFLSLRQSGKVEFSPEFVALLEELGRRHLEFILSWPVAYTNHSLVDLHGIAALCHTLDPFSASEGYNFINREYKKILTSQFEENGMHREHSPEYHVFAHTYLKILIRSGWFDTNALTELANKSQKVLDWLHMPDNRWTPVGDSSGGAKSKGAHKYLDNEDIFNQSGYAIVKKISPEQASYLFFMGAFHSFTHKHSDDLSIIWYEDTDILCDAGKFAYQKSDKRSYVESTRAHNTIEINGLTTLVRSGQHKSVAPATYIQEVRRLDELYLLGGAMTVSHADTRHSRYLLYCPGKFLIVRDTLKSRQNNVYRANWHFPPGAVIESFENSLNLALPKKLYANFFSDHDGVLRTAQGQLEPELQGFISPAYGELIPNLCATYEVEAKSCEILSVFFLNEEPALGFFDRNLLFFNTYLYDLKMDSLSRL